MITEVLSPPSSFFLFTLPINECCHHKLSFSFFWSEQNNNWQNVKRAPRSSVMIHTRRGEEDFFFLSHLTPRRTRTGSERVRSHVVRVCKMVRYCFCSFFLLSSFHVSLFLDGVWMQRRVHSSCPYSTRTIIFRVSPAKTKKSKPNTHTHKKKKISSDHDRLSLSRLKLFYLRTHTHSLTHSLNIELPQRLLWTWNRYRSSFLCFEAKHFLWLLWSVFICKKRPNAVASVVW